jgi:hypothetical protein
MWWVNNNNNNNIDVWFYIVPHWTLQSNPRCLSLLEDIYVACCVYTVAQVNTILSGDNTLWTVGLVFSWKYEIWHTRFISASIFRGTSKLTPMFLTCSAANISLQSCAVSLKWPDSKYSLRHQNKSTLFIFNVHKIYKSQNRIIYAN